MIYKTILRGRLEFGSSSSYEKVVKMYQRRAEGFYKFDLLLKEEDGIFDDTNFTLDVPHLLVANTPDKTWKNTISMIEELSQLAVTGYIVGWKMRPEDNVVVEHIIVEPKSDKAVVQEFRNGRSLVKIAGKENEAKDALNRAIEKYERHAAAYERRGRVNFMLKNYDAAHYDYTKSIDLNPTNPSPFMGRAFVFINKNEITKAIADLDQCVKLSIPLQPIYWKARRLKAECHLQHKEYDKVIFELKFFTKRAYASTDPNYKWRKNAFMSYGKALAESGDLAEAFRAFEAATQIKEGHVLMSEADQHYYQQLLGQKKGKPEAPAPAPTKKSKKAFTKS